MLYTYSSNVSALKAKVQHNELFQDTELCCVCVVRDALRKGDLQKNV